MPGVQWRRANRMAPLARREYLPAPERDAVIRLCTTPRRHGRACPTAVRFDKTGCKVQVARNPHASCPGLSRASTPSGSRRLRKFIATAPRGWPGQARPRRREVQFHIDSLARRDFLAQPDSRGLVPGIHAQRPSPTSKVVCSGAACGRMLRIRLGIAGTSPAMTSKGSAQPNYVPDSETFRFPRTALHFRGRPVSEGARRSILASKHLCKAIVNSVYPRTRRFGFL
jgi:hypothetical protein